MESSGSRSRLRSEFAGQADPLSRSSLFRSRAILERIGRAVDAGAGDRLLDVACGPGLLAGHLGHCARRVMGLDVTPEMLTRARRHALDQEGVTLPVVCATADSLPLANGSFERVVSRLALHHFEALDASLDEMSRVLASNGRLVIADLVASEDPEQATLHDELERLRDPSHVRLLPASELLQRLAALGLEVELVDRWDSPRELGEWVAITGRSERLEPLRARMLALLAQRRDPGIGLAERDGALHFVHHWVIAVARRGRG